jgi:hypothetical protein
MFTTGLMTVLGSAIVAVSAAPNAPTWQPDYATAVSKAAESKKPLAVFIGHGKSGQAAVVAGGLDATEVKTLSESYVSVYVDTDTESGKKLAANFELSEGVVISDRTGGLQAVRHEGPVTKTELNGYLTKYGEPTVVVTTTEYGGRARRPIINAVQNVTHLLSGSSYVPYCPSCQRR